MATDRFDELMGLLLDDEIRQEQLDELVSICRNDPEKLLELKRHLEISDRLHQYETDARSSLRFTSALESRISAESESDDFVSRFSSLAENAQPKPKALTDNSSWLKTGLFSLVLALSLVVTFLLFVPPSQPESGETARKDAESEDLGVAVVMRMVDVDGLSQRELEPGASLPPSRLTFDSGLMQLEFYSGASVIVEGPASIEIVSPLELKLHQGKLRARVPEVAHGFTVKSAEVDVIDRGTEFAIAATGEGGTEVHVIDGLVELFPVDEQMSIHRKLLAGQAVSVAEGKAEEIISRGDEFVSSQLLESLLRDLSRESRDRWNHKQKALANDPSVIARFIFKRNENDDRQLVGYTGDGNEILGAIVGCQWSDGRWPGKSALEFKRPGDRVRVDIPGKFDSLTYSAWVRVDALDRPYNSLLLTDRWGVNCPHWQIHKSGGLILGVRHPDEKQHKDYETAPVFDAYQLGRWVHLAAVYDSVNREVVHYVDGKAVERFPMRKAAAGPLVIGRATIGNWVNPSDANSTRVRNFNGRIDELILFEKALDAKEIQLLYEAGKP